MIATYDVIIAGGSHTGLALGLALRHLGGGEIRVAIVERRVLHGAATAQASPDVAGDPRAFAVAAGSRHLLDRLGVWAGIAAFAEPVHAIEITDSRLDDAIRPIALGYDNHIAGGSAATHIVEAARLEAALLDHVRRDHGLTLLAPAEIAHFAAGGAGVTVDLRDGRSLKAGLLVAADGARSPVRRISGIGSIAWNPGQVAIVTTVTHERPHAGRAVQHFLPAGPFAILPMTDLSAHANAGPVEGARAGLVHRSCVTWTEEAEVGAAIVAGSDAAFHAAVEKRFGWKLGAIRIAGARALWPLDLHVARALVADKVALVGDAARTVHPLAGQGLNLGFKDVAALAECVVDAMRVGLTAGDATALQRYERWRRFDSTSATTAFTALNALFARESAVLRAARGVGLGALDRLPGLKQLLVDEAAGLTGDLPGLMRRPAI